MWNDFKNYFLFELICIIVTLIVTIGTYHLAIMFPVVKYLLMGMGFGVVIIVVINSILDLFD